MQSHGLKEVFIFAFKLNKLKGTILQFTSHTPNIVFKRHLQLEVWVSPIESPSRESHFEYSLMQCRVHIYLVKKTLILKLKITNKSQS